MTYFYTLSSPHFLLQFQYAFFVLIITDYYSLNTQLNLIPTNA